MLDLDFEITGRQPATALHDFIAKALLATPNSRLELICDFRTMNSINRICAPTCMQILPLQIIEFLWQSLIKFIDFPYAFEHESGP